MPSNTVTEFDFHAEMSENVTVGKDYVVLFLINTLTCQNYFTQVKKNTI